MCRRDDSNGRHRRSHRPVAPLEVSRAVPSPAPGSRLSRPRSLGEASGPIGAVPWPRPEVPTSTPRRRERSAMDPDDAVRSRAGPMVGRFGPFGSRPCRDPSPGGPRSMESRVTRRGGGCETGEYAHRNPMNAGAPAVMEAARENKPGMATLLACPRRRTPLHPSRFRWRRDAGRGVHDPPTGRRLSESESRNRVSSIRTNGFEPDTSRARRGVST